MKLLTVIIDDDTLQHSILENYISKENELELIEKFTDPVLGLKFCENNHVDLIFLDVEMPEITGLEFLDSLKNFTGRIILCTSHDEYAIKAFEFSVSGYLLKPYKFSQFDKAVKKVSQELSSITKTTTETEETIFIKHNGVLHKVDLKEIFLIECIGDYVNIHTLKEKFTIHSTMKSMETKFSNLGFLRVHRSFLIRVNQIEDIEDDSLFINGKIIPIGKTYRQQVYKSLNIL